MFQHESSLWTSNLNSCDFFFLSLRKIKRGGGETSHDTTRYFHLSLFSSNDISDGFKWKEGWKKMKGEMIDMYRVMLEEEVSMNV